MRRIIGWSIPLLLIAIGLLKRFISTMPWMFVAPLNGVSEREYYQAPR